MPAKSKAQQRFMGMVRAYQKGELRTSSKQISDAAHSMSMKDVKDFAATKHEGLPEHTKNAMIKFSNCTTHDQNTPESFDTQQKPIQVRRLRGTTSSQTKAWHEDAWAKSTEGKSGKKQTFEVIEDKKAFFNGFAKAAAAQGFTPGQTLEFIQKLATPSWMEPYLPGAADTAASFASLPPINALAGAGIGAGLGGVGGYLAGRDTEHPEHDHRIRDAVLGTLGGGVAGGVGGGLGTVAVLANKHPEIFHRLLAGMAAQQPK